MKNFGTGMDAATRHALNKQDRADYQAGKMSAGDYFTRLRSRMPPQTSNGADLIREDRDDPRR
jgi:hypothetical protein